MNVKTFLDAQKVMQNYAKNEYLIKKHDSLFKTCPVRLNHAIKHWNMWLAIDKHLTTLKTGKNSNYTCILYYRKFLSHLFWITLYTNDEGKTLLMRILSSIWIFFSPRTRFIPFWKQDKKNKEIQKASFRRFWRCSRSERLKS